ncbi:dynactin subunit 3 isoform X1 [Gopherus evgoodei]|uniref:dynactin subunit 3 isoform X1 n=1 Tax=Gopherus evgoodei TaxID=1825980 RepID=UPI0011CFD853|nr:dynactin subunit 3 isoform X1 [Gopherus evgoodei]
MAATAGLQERVEALERRVFGAGAARGPRKVRGWAGSSAPPARPAADGLVKVQVALGNIASKRERVKILYKKIEDLIKYLDPQYIDRMAVPDAMKLQFILAEEQFILSQVALLEQVNNLQPFLDSAHIKAAPDHAAKLQRLAQIHIQQQDQCEAVTENVRVLLEDYNKMTLLLSKQFVQWDEMLTQLEAAKQVKPMAE